MWKFLVIPVMVQLTLIVAGEDSSPQAVEAALRDSLLKNYDKRVRPRSSTVVSISAVTLLDIDVHEAEHSMDVHSWMHFNWEDPRLVWSQESHPGVKTIGFEFDSLWTPDLKIYNARDHTSYASGADVLLVVQPSGQVIFVPPVNLRFYCVMDLTFWPHDSHQCMAKIGSWIYNVDQVDLRPTSDTPQVNLSSMSVGEGEETFRILNSKEDITVTEWDLEESSIVRHEAKYPCCEELYVAVRINMKVRRNAPAFAWTVKVPAVCLSLLSLVLFLLPPDAGEKVIFGGLCLILHVFFIAYANHVIAQAPSHAPLIVQLACHQLVIVVAVVVVAALLVRMAKSPHSSPLPASLKQALISASRPLCLSNYRELVTGSKQDLGTSHKSDEVELGERNEREAPWERRYQNEWLLLAAVLDRLALVLCLVEAFVLLVRFSVVL